MSITNRARYPRSKFLKAAEIRPYATVDGQTYVLVGYEDGDEDTPLVALAMTDTPAKEQLHATPLHEVAKFCQGEIRRIES